MEIESYTDCSELNAIEDAWDRLSERELQFVPSFSELRHQLRASDRKFRICVATDNSQVIAIACFIYRRTIKRYEIATRKLFDLPVKEVSLFGSCVLGQPNEDVIRKFLWIIVEASGFDLINVGEVFIGSALHKAISDLHHGFVAWRIMRTKQLRWLIRLPGSFDDYLASLRATVKVRISRDCRRFEREAPEFRIMQRPEEVETFLRDAEKVSRLTYQWNLGYRVCNDESTRQQFMRLAKSETLRCYVAYLRGEPCAFGWGELSHRTFGFQATGYDPQYRTLSPGTALIMRMIRDLIENTNCEVFDFLAGGETGYKSRLGTLSLSCARMQVAQIYRPYSFALVALDQTINVTKNFIINLGELILGHGALKQRLKSALRPYGIGTY